MLVSGARFSKLLNNMYLSYFQNHPQLNTRQFTTRSKSKDRFNVLKLIKVVKVSVCISRSVIATKLLSKLCIIKSKEISCAWIQHVNIRYTVKSPQNYIKTICITFLSNKILVYSNLRCICLTKIMPMNKNTLEEYRCAK